MKIIYFWIFSALLGVVGLPINSIAQQQPSESFYDIKGLPLDQPPGALIRVAAYESLKFPGALSSRIMYVSVDPDGRKVAATAVVMIPNGLPHEGGWPIIAWAPGTVGIGRLCAPSMTDNLSKYGPYLKAWVDRGYAVVAIDYSGLGTTGRHFYSNRESNARDVIEAVRAASSTYENLRKAFVVIGHSQGGLAAIGVAETIGELKISPVEYKGAVAIAPGNGANHGYFRAIERSGVSDPTTMAYMLYYTATLKLAHLGLEYADQVSTDVETLMPAAENQCLDELKATLSSSVRFPKHFIKSSWVNHPVLKKYSENNQAGQKKAVGPLFITWGTGDSVISKNSINMIIQASCKHGSSIQLSEYPGASHSTVLALSRADIAEWISQQFSGSFRSPACGDAFRG